METYNFEEDSVETQRAIKSIERTLRNLNKQLSIVREQYPEANYYMACNTFNLLHRPSHTSLLDDLGDDQVDNVITSILLRNADCGDW